MSIYYDDTKGSFAVSPNECPDCGEPHYDTGCDAPGCDGVSFPCCGTGCDIDVAGDGRCGTALAEENAAEHDERIDRERAAFGLSPITDKAEEATSGE